MILPPPTFAKKSAVSNSGATSFNARLPGSATTKRHGKLNTISAQWPDVCGQNYTVCRGSRAARRIRPIGKRVGPRPRTYWSIENSFDSRLLITHRFKLDAILEAYDTFFRAA